MDKIMSLFYETCLGQTDDRKIKFSDLTDEQQKLIELARAGKNVLVDACIGSGKTTAIQALCDEFHGKRILYLTYNTLLKLDAKNKINNQGATVTNYHGYVYSVLLRNDIRVGVSDLLQTFNRIKPSLPAKFDLIVLDEYQDIDQEISELLLYIKSQNPGAQIIAVGDMQQKIYDKTTLDVSKFINKFVGRHTNLSFTKCFRLNKDHANMLGRIWHKTIHGVNDNCRVRVMHINDVVPYLAKQKPEDVLCLGSRTGLMPSVLNRLEDTAPTVYNKHTTYASIRDRGMGVQPSSDNAIFTTYDGCKGLERRICVVFDFTEQYWAVRTGKPQTKYEIVRNIFCVAASRGKDEIIFVSDDHSTLLSENVLCQATKTNTEFGKPFSISDMFSFKYKEDIEDCFRYLSIKEIPTTDHTVINVRSHDELIDLSPCVDIYQNASYFSSYDIDSEIGFYALLHDEVACDPIAEDASLDAKILYLATMITMQTRYVAQVTMPIVTVEQAEKIHKRLSVIFDGSEPTQYDCRIGFRDKYDLTCDMAGRIDVMKNDIPYELRFCEDLSHEDFLQLGCYLIADGRSKGVLWNVRNNQMYQVSVLKKNQKPFLDAVIRTITKGLITKYKPVF